MAIAKGPDFGLTLKSGSLSLIDFFFFMTSMAEGILQNVYKIAKVYDEIPQKCTIKEIKLGSRQIDEGSGHLLKLEELIKKAGKEKHMNLDEPVFSMVLTGGEFAYRRKDGVYVIPLSCLRY